MSVWTQVTGNITLDNWDFLQNIEISEQIKKIPEIIGKISIYYAPVETVVPCGSEGSLQYHAYQNNEENHMQNIALSITGSLRDFEEADHCVIEEWLNNYVTSENFKKIDLSVRGGVLYCHDETKDRSTIYHYNPDSEEWSSVVVPLVALT